MIRHLAKYVGEFKKAAILTPVTMIGEVAMEVALPYVTRSLIDQGIEKGSMPGIILYGAILVACALVSLLFGVLSGRFAARASAGYGRNLRRAIYDNVQSFSFRNIDRFSTASLITRLTTDVTNVQGAFQMIIRMAVRAPMMFIFSLVMAFTINARLSLIFVCIIPFLVAGLYLIIKNAHPIFERVFKTYDRLNTVVRENLRGVRVVKSFVREEHEDEKFKKVSTSVFNDFSKAEKILAFNGPLMQICMYTCLLVSAWFGARMIIGGGAASPGTLTVGDLQSIISYAVQILMSLMMLSMVFVMITIARASAERIDEVLREESDLHNAEAPDMTVTDGSIEFDHVYFSYSSDEAHMALKDVCLNIPSGATVGVLGGTGSAKSTLVSLIPRLYDATRGVVRVGGRDVREIDIKTLRDQVAMVLQKNELFSGTVAENLRWGDEHATDEQLEHVCRIAQADGFIKAFPDGYQAHIEQGGTNVSGGQKQRLCIARALLKRPKILIMDDSTSAVDTATDHSIRAAMRKEMPGTTKIIIAQRVASVMDADMIIIMDNGCVRDVGTHDELMRTSAIYKDVYTQQIKEADAV